MKLEMNVIPMVPQQLSPNLYKGCTKKTLPTRMQSHKRKKKVANENVKSQTSNESFKREKKVPNKNELKQK